MKILGIAFLSDASAAVIKDGKVISAISEERLNRIKLWNGVPHQAIRAALDLAGLRLDDIDLVATHGAAPPEPDAAPYAEKEQAILRSQLSPEQREMQIQCLRDRHEHEKKVLGTRTPNYLKEIKALGKPVKTFGHHYAHAATAYFGSGWKDCLVLTADGWGEDASSTLWHGKDGKLVPLTRSHTFDSLGYFYGSITKALNFVPHRHEGKILGLAAYCPEPKSYPHIRAMVDYDAQRKAFVGRMENGLYRPRFENPALKELVQNFSREDVSSAAQKTLEEVVTACVRDFCHLSPRIALAGGVFANVKLNQRILELPGIEEVYVFPNMGDGGLSVGAAMLAHSMSTGMKPSAVESVLLGPEYSDDEIGRALAASGFRYKQFANVEDEIGALLAAGHIVAHFDGRMEYGPRALGNRSILYQALDPSVNDWLNRQLNRSEFMPFAPATLEEYARDYYINLDGGRQAAKYMTMTFDCTEKMKREAPAAVHIDGTARPQLVSKTDYPRFHKILTAYHRRTGLASVINTSYNMHEEPIVCSAADALRAFALSRIPYLAMGSYIVQMEEKPVAAAQGRLDDSAHSDR